MTLTGPWKRRPSSWCRAAHRARASVDAWCPQSGAWPHHGTTSAVEQWPQTKIRSLALPGSIAGVIAVLEGRRAGRVGRVVLARRLSWCPAVRAAVLAVDLAADSRDGDMQLHGPLPDRPRRQDEHRRQVARPGLPGLQRAHRCRRRDHGPVPGGGPHRPVRRGVDGPRRRPRFRGQGHLGGDDAPVLFAPRVDHRRPARPRRGSRSATAARRPSANWRSWRSRRTSPRARATKARWIARSCTRAGRTSWCAPRASRWRRSPRKRQGEPVPPLVLRQGPPLRRQRPGRHAPRRPARLDGPGRARLGP
jgi:hypothetical protein